MRAAQLTYKDAGDVAEYLMGADKVDTEMLTSALINALTRVDRLEARVEALRKEVEFIRFGPPATP